MKNLWQSKKNKKDNSKKFNNINTDILIIGGGIAGLSTAYFLNSCNKKITLIDKDIIGNGITSKSTAKITYLQGIIYQTLEKRFGFEKSCEYYNSQKDAIKYIIKIIKENNISCDLKKSSSIIFTTKRNNKNKIKKEKEILEKFGVKVNDINIKKTSGIKVDDTFTFNPVKYLNGLYNILKNKIDIYINVTAQNISFNNNYIITTDKGVINAKIVIIASHYPFFLKPLFIPLKTYIKREYINAGYFKENSDFNAINIDKNLYSIRYYKNYLLYVSNAHKLTNKTDYQKNYQKSIKDYKRNFKKNPEYTWMNQDIMSNDNLPFIGKIKENMYIATAFNSWGITNGTISGKILSDLIINNDSQYKKLFSPNRINMYLLGNSFLGVFSYLKIYILAIFKKNKPFYIKINNIIYGVYVDDNNKKHMIKLVCPHMKCNLLFNRQEKTWDCPCHGSRFSLDGDLLEGPATKNLKRNK